MGGKSSSETSQTANTQTRYETDTTTNDLSGSEGSVQQGEGAGFFSLSNGVNVDNGGKIEVTDFGVLGKAIENVAGLSNNALKYGREQLDSYLDTSTALVQDVLMSSAGQLKSQQGAAGAALKFATTRGENDLKGVFPILVYGGVAVAALLLFSRKN